MDESILNAYNSISDILISQINPRSISTIILLILGSGVSLYLTWFGIKTLVNTVKNALNGRLKIGSNAHRNYYKNKLGWDDEDYNDNFNQW